MGRKFRPHQCPKCLHRRVQLCFAKTRVDAPVMLFVKNTTNRKCPDFKPKEEKTNG